ncbi:MAG: hypothetical protein HZB67_03335 [Candidatus Aenigmarchaeota archaeon]|nr:hypothetical protein [Candidatus Aenigmarchaeota archaeon]
MPNNYCTHRKIEPVQTYDPQNPFVDVIKIQDGICRCCGQGFTRKKYRGGKGAEDNPNLFGRLFGWSDWYLLKENPGSNVPSAIVDWREKLKKY